MSDSSMTGFPRSQAPPSHTPTTYRQTASGQPPSPADRRFACRVRPARLQHQCRRRASVFGRTPSAGRNPMRRTGPGARPQARCAGQSPARGSRLSSARQWRQPWLSGGPPSPTFAWLPWARQRLRPGRWCHGGARRWNRWLRAPGRGQSWFSK
jgi:hypothetical protein